MQDKIKSFDTFDEFYTWMEAPETDGKNGKSEELGLKTEIRRQSLDIVGHTLKAKSIDARNKKMENMGYKERMQIVYKEIHG